MPLQAQALNELIESLRRLIPYSLVQHHVPGLNIALALDGQIVLEEGFGFADLASHARMTAETVTHAGSMSKLYAATAVMQLVESGVLELDAPVNRYLPDLQIHNPLGEREITLLDLLTHRSGINGGIDVHCDFELTGPVSETLKPRYQRERLYNYGGDELPLWSAKVGEKLQYSNLGTATLGYVVESANPEKLDFPTYVQRHIMDPLGMTSSIQPVNQDPASLPAHIQGRLSTGYAAFHDRLVPTPTLYLGDYPAGSLLTTPGDHIRLLLAFLNGGEWNGSRLLKPDSVRQMLTPQVSVTEDQKIGLIWWVSRLEGLEFFGHSGAYMFGWHNISLACPQYNMALVVCANKWNMVAGGDRYSASMDIARFIALWLQREDAGKRLQKPQKTWAWQVSYVRGLMMAEELLAALGIPSPITDRMLDDMLEGTRPHPDLADAGDWDGQGFRAGVEDMQKVEKTPAGIRAFLKSEACRVAYEDLVFIYRQINPYSIQPLIPSMLT